MVYITSEGSLALFCSHRGQKICWTRTISHDVIAPDFYERDQSVRMSAGVIVRALYAQLESILQ